MKIVIISDIHNNLANLKKVLDYCASNKIQKIICCGDLANMESLDFLNDNFTRDIYYTFGNMDDGQMADEICHPEFTEGSNKLDSSTSLGTTCRYKNTFIFKKFGEITLENKNIAFVHYPDAAKKLCESGKYDFVFHGHTHKPWVAPVETSANQRPKKCTLLNPGNVANEIYPPTFAVWETDNDKFNLIRINELK
jgi:hypothetical protein